MADAVRQGREHGAGKKHMQSRSIEQKHRAEQTCSIEQSRRVEGASEGGRGSA